MKKKEIYGTILIALGLGALIFLYKGYYLPKKEVESMTPAQLKASVTNTKV